MGYSGFFLLCVVCIFNVTWVYGIVDRIPALLGARHSAVPPIELRLAAVDEAEAVGETNRIGSVYSADRSR